MIAGRQTLCFLRNLRLDQFVASGEDEYVDIARRAAGDVAALGALRADLRARMAASALIDAAKFTRNLEQAYRRVWQEWCGAFALDGDAASPRATADH
jgi:predicted O-linked N-acetylglucosamine transferase (SPINDLY family)